MEIARELLNIYFPRLNSLDAGKQRWSKTNYASLIKSMNVYLYIYIFIMLAVKQ